MLQNLFGFLPELIAKIQTNFYTSANLNGYFLNLVYWLYSGLFLLRLSFSASTLLLGSS